MDKTVSIIFCGGCNPRIDRGRVAEKVNAALSGRGYRVSYNSREADFIVYLSGCAANCARRYSAADNPSVVVAGAAVDTTATDQTHLVAEIVEKVRSYFG